MRNILKEGLQAFVIGFVLPAVLISFVMLMTKPVMGGEETKPIVTTAPDVVIPETKNPTQPYNEKRLHICVIQDGERTEMELEAYIFGVVLGEMPASFELEALKAQAVVARTYTLKACVDSSRHRGAVCTESGCCQAYQDPQAYLEKGGTEEALLKVKEAVEQTSGQVLTYEDELITATYFSCSGGSTEDAAAVWGYDVPYLKAVESPGEEDASVFTKKVTFTASEFQKKLAIRLSGEPEDWFGKVRYTPGGGVQTIVIGGVSYRGTTIRSLLKLRSTNFTVSVNGESITFTTKGYGHRVGMSQYGADAMAVTGAGYKEILAHYYQGTKLETYPFE